MSDGMFGAEAPGVVWRPAEGHRRRSRVEAFLRREGLDGLPALHERSLADPDWFWRAALADLGVEFSTDYSALKDESRGPRLPRWFVGGRLKVVTSCVDKRALSRDRAVVCERDDGRRQEISRAGLHREVGVLAANLVQLGVGEGDRVAVFMPTCVEVVVAFMAVAKIGAVVVPVFSGFGPEALAARLQGSEAVLVITATGSTRRGAPVDMQAVASTAVAESESVRHVIVAETSPTIAAAGGEQVTVWSALRRDLEVPGTVQLDANAPLALMFTSGTTGSPKGIVLSHAGFLSKTAADFGYLFDVQSDDVVAWSVDFGWMLGPLLTLVGLHFGAELVLIEGVPDHPGPRRLWEIAERHDVTLLGIAPTAARMLRAHGEAGLPQTHLPSLRAFASTGEPWDEATWLWLFDEIGGRAHPILNYTGGTEVGGGLLGCYTTLPQKPAAFSGPVPGLAVGVRVGGHRAAAGEMGELVVANTWPGMTHSFWRDDERYLETYWPEGEGPWVQGDLASVDADGFWVVHGRSDDTLKLAGRRIGPTEIEAGLVGDGVAEAAVIGVPHDLRGQAAVGFVVLRPGISEADIDEEEYRRRVTASIGRSLVPAAVYLVPALPKTKNGKVMRRVIRSRYLGLDAGDLSSMDSEFRLEAMVPSVRDFEASGAWLRSWPIPT